MPRRILVCVLFLLFANFAEDHAKLIAKSQPTGNYASIMLRKIQRLLELMGQEPGRGSVSLSLKDYRELIFETPRNHTTFVLFYNDNAVCPNCDEVMQSFERISRSFRRAYMKHDPKTSSWDIQVLAFFVRVKMSEGHRQMLVDLNPSRPSLFYFAPAHSSKYNQFERMEQGFFESEFAEEQYYLERILSFIDHTSDIQISLDRETRPSTLMSSFLTAGLVGIMILFNIYHFGYWDVFMSAFSNGNYSYIFTIVIIWLLSGQMFNYIRATPMVGSNGFSIMSIIYPGNRGQYGIESIIVMVLYAMMMYAFTDLIETRERQLEQRLSIRQVQGSLVTGLSGFYFAFMALQVVSNLKTGRF